MLLPFLTGDAGNPIAEIFAHNMDHPMVHLGPVSITKFTLNMWVAAGILALALAKADKKTMVPKGRLRGLFESIYFFVRDEIVYPIMGEHHGHSFMPLFLTLFSFIFVTNLVGMIPLPGIGGAATSTLGLTIPLALTVFVVSIGAGIWYNGPFGFLKGFLPPGVPFFVLPILFPIEILGFVIKHGVLAIRLFANMLAGHLVLGGFLGLIFVFKSYGAVGIALPLALFISLLELLVCFLQAYVFTLLATLFIGGAVHPEH